jgi:RNA polymerase sigma-70 factor (family 1)
MMPGQSPNELTNILLQVSKGDEQAFALLFKIYHPILTGYLLAITESEELTQEIVQDVFMKIWNNRSTLNDIDCFKSYLMVAARNHAFNCLKRIAREKKKEKSWFENVLNPEHQEEADADHVDYAGMMDATIELLPPQQKKVYTLGYMNRMKHREIAIEMDIATETVKKHMLLALRFIKNHLSQVTSLLLLMMVI